LKFYTKNIMPNVLYRHIKQLVEMHRWKARNYADFAPQKVKQFVLERYGVKNGVWVETGTYFGVTTKFLSERYPMVYSIEPSLDLYQIAEKNFQGTNVELFNDVSENVLPKLLLNLVGPINFWLDGHFSEGVTYKGLKNCPIEEELNAISDNLEQYENISIFIDDARCFLPSENNDYPSLDFIVDWARDNKMVWRIEHDIIVIQRSFD
jgi:hypothetical protein